MREFFYLSWKVAMRNWAVYQKNFTANILPTIVDPAFYLVVFGYWLGSHVQQIEGMPYLRYLAPGMVLTTCLYTAFFEASYGFFVRREFQGVYKAMVTTPIGPHEIIAGEMIWVMLKGAAMATVVALVLAVFRVIDVRYLALVPIIGGLVGLGCGGIGLLSASLVRNIDQFQTVYALIISPMFFVSGIFFPVEHLSPWIRAACQLSPLYHGVKMGQATLWPGDLLRAWLVHGSALVALTVVILILATRKAYSKLYR